MLCTKEHIYSYGYDMNLSKYNIKLKQSEATRQMNQRVTAMKLLKSAGEGTI
jgi:hypothetical protein